MSPFFLTNLFLFFVKYMKNIKKKIIKNNAYIFPKMLQFLFLSTHGSLTKLFNSKAEVYNRRA